MARKKIAKAVEDYRNFAEPKFYLVTLERKDRAFLSNNPLDFINMKIGVMFAGQIQDNVRELLATFPNFRHVYNQPITREEFLRG